MQKHLENDEALSNLSTDAHTHPYLYASEDYWYLYLHCYLLSLSLCISYACFVQTFPSPQSFVSYPSVTPCKSHSRLYPGDKEKAPPLVCVCQAVYWALCPHNDLMESTTQCIWFYSPILQMRKPWLRGYRVYSRASRLACWKGLFALNYPSPQNQWCGDGTWHIWSTSPVTFEENTAPSLCATRLP